MELNFEGLRLQIEEPGCEMWSGTKQWRYESSFKAHANSRSRALTNWSPTAEKTEKRAWADKWRHLFDNQSQELSASSYVMDKAQLPSGVVLVTDPSCNYSHTHDPQKHTPAPSCKADMPRGKIGQYCIGQDIVYRRVCLGDMRSDDLPKIRSDRTL